MLEGSFTIPFPKVVSRQEFTVFLITEYRAVGSWPPSLPEEPPHTPKHLHLSWRYWAPSLLNLWVLQVQLLVYFDDATRLQWKIPLPLSSFLLPYSLICFIFNYLYRRDQQFTNNGINQNVSVLNQPSNKLEKPISAVYAKLNYNSRIFNLKLWFWNIVIKINRSNHHCNNFRIILIVLVMLLDTCFAIFTLLTLGSQKPWEGRSPLAAMISWQ